MSKIAGDHHVMTMDMGVAEVLREGLSRRRDRDCSCRCVFPSLAVSVASGVGPAASLQTSRQCSY